MKKVKKKKKRTQHPFLFCDCFDCTPFTSRLSRLYPLTITRQCDRKEKRGERKEEKKEKKKRKEERKKEKKRKEERKKEKKKKENYWLDFFFFNKKKKKISSLIPFLNLTMLLLFLFLFLLNTIILKLTKNGDIKKHRPQTPKQKRNFSLPFF